jgi:hypothetical protein
MNFVQANIEYLRNWPFTRTEVAFQWISKDGNQGQKDHILSDHSSNKLEIKNKKITRKISYVWGK